MKTVSSVDLERYAGRWYEIAKIPNRFQKKCASGASAEYSLRGDGRIDVVNRCITGDGSVNEASGVARVVDTASNAKLQVSFVSFFGWRPFWGDYWIIGLDADYGWAVVGHPQRKYGWMLARSPAIDPGQVDKMFAIAVAAGYKRADFEIVEQ